MSDHVKKVADHIRQVIRSRDINQALPARFFFKNNYEDDLCNILGMQCLTDKRDQRYADCMLLGVPVEIKKTRANAFWMDEVRYAEIFAKKKGLSFAANLRDLAAADSVTLFIKTRVTKWVKKVTNLYCIDSAKLLDLLMIDEKYCKSLLSRYAELQKNNHRVNSQHCITVKQLMDTGCCIEINVSNDEPRYGRHQTDVGRSKYPPTHARRDTGGLREMGLVKIGEPSVEASKETSEEETTPQKVREGETHPEVIKETKPKKVRIEHLEKETKPKKVRIEHVEKETKPKKVKSEPTEEETKPKKVKEKEGKKKKTKKEDVEKKKTRKKDLEEDVPKPKKKTKTDKKTRKSKG